MKKRLRKKTLVVMLILLSMSGLFPAGYGNHIKAGAAGHGLSNPKVKSKIIYGVVYGKPDKGTLVWETTWDSVYFGNYYQSNSKEKEPIKWRVLSVKGNDAFLISDKALDFQPYNTVKSEGTWEESSLCAWLNGSFIKTAFSEGEQKAIKTDLFGKVYIPSADDMINSSYGFPMAGSKDVSTTGGGVGRVRMTIPTNYAKALGASADKYYFNATTWWIRSLKKRPTKAACVDSEGELVTSLPSRSVLENGVPKPVVYMPKTYLDTNDLTNQNQKDKYAVRPVLHLDLTHKVWKKAGKVTGGIWYKKQPPEERVRIVTLKNRKKRQVAITWENLDSVGYQLSYSTNKKFKKKTTKNKYVKGKSYESGKMKTTIKKLKKKKTYYFRIRGYCLDDKKKVYGKWSKKKKVKIKK